MDHIAILRKARISKGDNLLKDILEGKKTIESRWYVNKISPWDNIHKDDAVYFKESGNPVTARAKVAKVLQFEKLNTDTIKSILENYGSAISPNTSPEQWFSWAADQTKKRFCILVFLKDIEKVHPFNIDKTGYGNSSAWLAVGSIDKVRI